MEKKTSDTFKINPVNTIAIYGNAGAGKDFTASYTATDRQEFDVTTF